MSPFLHRKVGRREMIASMAFVFGFLACAKPEASSSPEPTPNLTYQPFDAAFVGSTSRIVEQDFEGQVVTTRQGVRIYIRAGLAQTDTGYFASFVVDSAVQSEGQAGAPLGERLGKGVSDATALTPTLSQRERGLNEERKPSDQETTRDNHDQQRKCRVSLPAEAESAGSAPRRLGAYRV